MRVLAVARALLPFRRRSTTTGKSRRRGTGEIKRPKSSLLFGSQPPRPAAVGNHDGAEPLHEGTRHWWEGRGFKEKKCEIDRFSR